MNVLDANATLILSVSFPLTGGTEYTVDIAAKTGRPFKIVDLMSEEAEKEIREWMLSLECVDGLSKETVVLNVAGPRESRFPGIFKFHQP